LTLEPTPPYRKKCASKNVSRDQSPGKEVARLSELSKVTHNELIERGLTEEEYALLDQKGYRNERIIDDYHDGRR